MKFNSDQWLGIIRQVLTFAAGYIATQGTISSSVADQITGGIMALTTVIWSIAAKKKVEGVHQGDPVSKIFQRK